LLEHDGYVTALRVRNAFLGITIEENTLLAIYKKYIDDFYKKVGKTKTIGSWANFKFSYQHVQAFIEIRYKSEDISLREIEEDSIFDFENYLISVKKLKTNMIAGYLKTLKRVVRTAVTKGLLSKSPFAEHKTKTELTSRAFLTQ
tara:strand:+ start:334 stop:768 length:435 start_codon:yes stop_codon:yes gene_type:complete